MLSCFLRHRGLRKQKPEIVEKRSTWSDLKLFESKTEGTSTMSEKLEGLHSVRKLLEAQLTPDLPAHLLPQLAREYRQVLKEIDEEAGLGDQSASPAARLKAARRASAG